MPHKWCIHIPSRVHVIRNTFVVVVVFVFIIYSAYLFKWVSEWLCVCVNLHIIKLKPKNATTRNERDMKRFPFIVIDICSGYIPHRIVAENEKLLSENALVMCIRNCTKYFICEHNEIYSRICASAMYRTH